MKPDTDPRVWDTLAFLLRSSDREAVVHRLLGCCLHGPDDFGTMLVHLPADLVRARADAVAGRAASRDLDRAAEALGRAALAARHGPCCADPACPCRAVHDEGIDAFVARAVASTVARLRATHDVYHQRLGALLDQKIQPLGVSSDEQPIQPHTHTMSHWSASP